MQIIQISNEFFCTQFDENRSPNDRLWCSQLNDNYKLLHCLSVVSRYCDDFLLCLLRLKFRFHMPVCFTYFIFNIYQNQLRVPRARTSTLLYENVSFYTFNVFLSADMNFFSSMCVCMYARQFLRCKDRLCHIYYIH